MNMAGKKTPTTSVPFFWTTQYGKSIRYCGYAFQYDEIIFEGNVEELKFIGYYVKNDKVLAAVAINMDPIISAVAELMAANKMPTVKELKVGNVDLVKHGVMSLLCTLAVPLCW